MTKNELTPLNFFIKRAEYWDRGSSMITEMHHARIKT